METSVQYVNALPTKAFFVTMLTKDVSLPSAIMDLIDNSIDGALRLRGEEPLTGLEVHITISGNKFAIQDNCGGIPLDIARKYAFRFGRADDAPPFENSVGLFGVGMKRAIFKLGRSFQVHSESSDSSFRVDVDVDRWQQEKKWGFPLRIGIVDSGLSGGKATGTRIKVNRLFPGVAEQFELSRFIARVQTEISAKHQAYLERGLTIRVNRRLLVGTTVKLAYLPGHLRPAYEERHYDGVSVKLFSGVGEAGRQARREAGWYVYCNGRMVVMADQTELTGWGSLGTRRVPRYHHQFARFRGCAFFTSRVSSKLPWNTTKDGLDVEASLYRTTRLRMASHMRPVINFLNALDKELEYTDEGKRVLTNMLGRAQYAPALSLPSAAVAEEFYCQSPPPAPPQPETTRIRYTRLKSEVAALKRVLRVRTNQAVGEKTFDWYLENECDFDG